jgi:hypothetical protein
MDEQKYSKLQNDCRRVRVFDELSEQVLIEVRNRRAKSIKSLSKTDKNGTETYKNYDTIENFRFY